VFKKPSIFGYESSGRSRDDDCECSKPSLPIYGNVGEAYRLLSKIADAEAKGNVGENI